MTVKEFKDIIDEMEAENSVEMEKVRNPISFS